MSNEEGRRCCPRYVTECLRSRDSKYPGFGLGSLGNQHRHLHHVYEV